MVEQFPYRCETQNGWNPLPSIDFKVRGKEGMNLTDAANIAEFDGPDYRDDLMFTHGGIGNSISCRIEVREFSDGTSIVTDSPRLISSWDTPRANQGRCGELIFLHLVRGMNAVTRSSRLITRRPETGLRGEN